MKSNASASDMSKGDFSNILNSATVTLRSEKFSDYVMFLKNADTDLNLFFGALSRKQPISNEDGHNIPFKGLNAFTQNNLYEQVKSQIMKSNMAICTPAPNFVGAQLNDGCQPIPPFLDSLKSNEYLPITQSTKIPTNLLKEHECIKKKNVKTGLLGKDVTSSNIELRLGQPPWAGNLVDSFVESPLFTFASSPKLHSLMQMTNSALNQYFSLLFVSVTVFNSL